MFVINLQLILLWKLSCDLQIDWLDIIDPLGFSNVGITDTLDIQMFVTINDYGSANGYAYGNIRLIYEQIECIDDELIEEEVPLGSQSYL